LLVGAVALMVAGSAHIGTSLAATSAQERVRAEAEAIAEAASKEFNTFIERQRVAQANPQKPQGPV
jgi:cytidine deaminase